MRHRSLQRRSIERFFLIFPFCRSQRKITLTSRDSALAVNSFKPVKKPFSTLLQPDPSQYEQAAAQGMTMNLKMEMISSGHPQTETDSASWSMSDMSLLSDFSDMSSSEPEQDIFLPDLSSSLESLHNIEAFNFFNEKQNLAFC